MVTWHPAQGTVQNDPHLGKVVDPVCLVPHDPRKCRDFHPVSTQSLRIRHSSRAVYYDPVAFLTSRRCWTR
jgi:hypothetical protein